MRTGKIDGYLFRLYSAHALSFVNCSLNRVDRSFWIHNYPFTKSTRFRFANTNNLDQSAIAGFASNTRHPARTDIEADSVLRSLGHSAVLLHDKLRDHCLRRAAVCDLSDFLSVFLDRSLRSFFDLSVTVLRLSALAFARGAVTEALATVFLSFAGSTTAAV